MARVVHVSCVHDARDNRILYKECASLAAAGHDVYLIARCSEDFRWFGVNVLGVSTPRNRFIRMIFTSVVCSYKAILLRPDVLHYHDPELIPLGILSRLIGVPTVYDVHENTATSIRDKDYLGILRYPITILVSLLEKIACQFNYIVIAEHSYEKRFPFATKVLNYPKKKTKYVSTIARNELPQNRVIYAGVAHEIRGSLIHANLVNLHPQVQVYLVGRMAADVRSAVIKKAGVNIDRVHIMGGESLVPYRKIEEIYSIGGWSAGLAVFPYSPDIADKELTKFFEYMSFGIPILCSNFPLWRRLIEDQGCGLCVDPADDDSISAGLLKLIDNRELAMAMGRVGENLVDSYTWESQAFELIELYGEILRKK